VKAHDALVSDPDDLQRFVRAQDGVYETALAELRAGSKQSHWMWFIFPQLRGLGHSPTAQYYGISSIDEARAYADHAILGPRLRQCVEALLPWSDRRTAEHILGAVDALKLRSSLTLFDVAEPGGLFAAGLAAFFGGEPDQRTLALLTAPR
jgi:uncharacterized protein (DUF1810 family)